MSTSSKINPKDGPFTRIVNKVLQGAIDANLTGPEWSALMQLILETWGRPGSPNECEWSAGKIKNMPSRTARMAWSNLVAKNIVTCSRPPVGSSPGIWGPNKNASSWTGRDTICRQPIAVKCDSLTATHCPLDGNPLPSRRQPIAVKTATHCRQKVSRSRENRDRRGAVDMRHETIDMIHHHHGSCISRDGGGDFFWISKYRTEVSGVYWADGLAVMAELTSEPVSAIDERHLAAYLGTPPDPLPDTWEECRRVLRARMDCLREGAAVAQREAAGGKIFAVRRIAIKRARVLLAARKRQEDDEE